LSKQILLPPGIAINDPRPIAFILRGVLFAVNHCRASMKAVNSISAK
jgi:hypothetical protein